MLWCLLYSGVVIFKFKFPIFITRKSIIKNYYKNGKCYKEKNNNDVMLLNKKFTHE